MADFSPSGIGDLPALTADTLTQPDQRLLGWLAEHVQEGDRFNRADPSYDRIELVQRYLVGDQRLDPDGDQIGWMPKITINEFRKAAQAHSSTLTDIKPIGAFKTENAAFKYHADVLNNYVVHWWMNTSADEPLSQVVKYALCGAGDCKVEWDDAFLGRGDTILTASDPRDTLPFRPGHSPNPQFWQGVTFREEHTVNALRGKYPQYAHLFVPSADTVLSSVMGRFRLAMRRLLTPFTDTLAGLGREVHTQRPASGGVVLYRTYLTDLTRNLTLKPIPMGLPNAGWSYVVQPGDLLYPQKRLIVWTEKGIIYDNASPYWHGQYPFGRLQLWDVPWQFLGCGIFPDLLPLQDAINANANDIRLGIKQWIEQQVEFDEEIVDRATMRRYDPRKPGARIKRQGGLPGEAFKKLEGPNPQILLLAMDFWREMTTKFRELSGLANLEQLLQLRQVPSGDTLERYQQALTPEIREEARRIERFLRGISGQIAANMFQFVTKDRRLAILGDAGLALEDFDSDPDSLVPAQQATLPMTDPGTGAPTQMPNPAYSPAFDASRPRRDRARALFPLLIFQVAPNSLLNINAMEQKLLKMQFAKMGYYDFWSLGEALEIANIGTPPAIPLPPLQPPDPAEVLHLLQQDPSGQMLAAKYTMDPQTGQLLEIRVPLTVTERLLAQNLLGIGMTVNPAGRKQTDQQAPQIEEKDGGERSTTTTSPK